MINDTQNTNIEKPDSKNDRMQLQQTKICCTQSQPKPSKNRNVWIKLCGGGVGGGVFVQPTQRSLSSIHFN